MHKTDLSYILNELGENRRNYFGAVSPPVIQTSNFCFPTVNDMREALRDEQEKYFYTRGNNPTVEILRKKVAALEHAEDALVFSSGIAAISAAILSNVKAGSHVVCVRNPYSWTNFLLSEYLPRFKVMTTFVDGRNPENFARAIRKNTSVIYLESPNTFVFDLQDIRSVCSIAKNKGITTICDNSCSSPVFQNPILLGADIVVHSATKYLAGHSDVVAGVLCSTRKRISTIFNREFMTLGACISPHDAWLMIRGLRTLKIRMEYISKSALQIASFLETHPKIERVIYPFLPSHPQYSVARHQMQNCGGLMNISLRTKSAAGLERFCNSLRRFLLACSWGGHESLVFPLTALERSKNYTQRRPRNMIRLYIGLDDTEVLINDLEQVLRKI